VKTFEEQVEEIMEHFQWERVRSVMLHLDWKWGDDTPSIYRMMKRTRELLTDVWGCGDESQCSAGGFTARRDYGHLRLLFAVGDWDTNDGDDEEPVASGGGK
jgi:hypothetical protein